MENQNWIEDGNGNRASIAYWGSREKAQVALDSLKNCTGCWNCTDCTCCSGCKNCSGCTGYKNFSGCKGHIGEKNTTGDFTPPPIPKIENIHARVYAAASGDDALDMRDWHSCNTTHCRAGCVVHLAGEAGYALEEHYGPALAAQLIYRESGYEINPARFYDNEVDALAHMKKLAEESV